MPLISIRNPSINSQLNTQKLSNHSQWCIQDSLSQSELSSTSSNQSSPIAVFIICTHKTKSHFKNVNNFYEFHDLQPKDMHFYTIRINNTKKYQKVNAIMLNDYYGPYSRKRTNFNPRLSLHGFHNTDQCKNKSWKVHFREYGPLFLPIKR